MRPSSMYCVVLVIFIAVACPYSQAIAIGSCTRGRATAYLVDTIGACGYGSYRDIYTFAPNTQFFNNSNVCGTCFEVTGPKGTIVMMAADECPTASNAQWCSGDIDHFDLNEEAFPELAELIWGVTYTSIRPIVCPTSDPVSVIAGWGASAVSQYFIQVHFFNHKVPLESVCVTDAESDSFTALARTTYNAFEWSPGREISYPVTYELTSVYGEKINVSIPSEPSPGQKITGATQFTQWNTVTENVCPSVYEYDIFVNGLTNAETRRTAENWRTTGDANVDFTASLPTNATKAAEYTLPEYQEWGFYTAGPAVPVNSIAAIEVQVRSAGSDISGLQLMWGEYSDNFIVSFPTVTSSWQHFYFPKAEFGSTMGAVSKLAFKNGENTEITLNIANFRILEDEGIVTPPSSSPSSSPSVSPPSVSPPSGSPSNTPSEPTTAPTEEAPTGQAASLLSSFASTSIIIVAAAVTLLFF